MIKINVLNVARKKEYRHYHSRKATLRLGCFVLRNKTRRYMGRERERERRKNKQMNLLFPSHAHCFFWHVLNMKPQSNTIPFDFVLKSKFDRDLILKMIQQKISESHMGVCIQMNNIASIAVCVRLSLCMSICLCLYNPTRIVPPLLELHSGFFSS